MGNHVEGIGHSERFGDDHGGVDRAGSSIKDGSLVNVAGFCGCTDNCDNTVVILGVGKTDEVRDEVSDVFAVFRRVFDDTEFKRAEQVECQAVLQCFMTEKDIALQEVSSNRVFGSTNNRQFFHFMTVGGDHHGAEGTQVDSNIQHVFCHRRNRLWDTASLYEESPHS